MRLNPNEGEFVYHRGWAYHLKGQNEEAVKDLNEAIRLDPKWPGYLIDRGIILAEGLHDLERGITDYDKAINLDPKRESTYRYRAYAKRLAHDYDQAIADYSTALELDPKSASAVEGRGLAKLLKGAHQEAAIDFARTVELAPPKDTVASYGAILEFEALQLNGEPDQAKAHLDAATPRLDSSRWPYQIIRYLRGEIDQDALNAAATDNNKQTEVHCYIGYEALIKGDKEKAVEQFRWVKDHGTRSFLEHELAVVELNRLAN
jgi:lipoprotein NlpI